MESTREVSADWLLRGKGEIWRNQTSLLRGNRPSSKDIKSRIVELIDQIRGKKIKDEHAIQLSEMAELLIDENNEQKRKMVKLHERQEEIIRTLKKLKLQL